MVNPPKGGPTMVEVVDTKEKGSDVALATYLLIDGFRKYYQMAVVISDDSDLVEPIKLTIEQIGLPVGVLHPSRTHSTQLSQVAKFYRPIRERALKVSLFPPTLIDANGTITKPATW
jgi:hypothetical protein